MKHRQDRAILKCISGIIFTCYRGCNTKYERSVHSVEARLVLISGSPGPIWPTGGCCTCGSHACYQRESNVATHLVPVVFALEAQAIRDW